MSDQIEWSRLTGWNIESVGFGTTEAVNISLIPVPNFGEEAMIALESPQIEIRYETKPGTDGKETVHVQIVITAEGARQLRERYREFFEVASSVKPGEYTSYEDWLKYQSPDGHSLELVFQEKGSHPIFSERKDDRDSAAEGRGSLSEDADDGYSRFPAVTRIRSVKAIREVSVAVGSDMIPLTGNRFIGINSNSLAEYVLEGDEFREIFRTGDLKGAVSNGEEVLMLDEDRVMVANAFNTMQEFIFRDGKWEPSGPRIESEQKDGLATLSTPYGLLKLDENRILVSNYGNDTLREFIFENGKWNPGAVIKSEEIDGIKTLACPKAMVRLDANRILVANNLNGTLREFTLENGEWKAGRVVESTKAGELDSINGPGKMLRMDENRVLLCNYFNHTVWEFSLKGNKWKARLLLDGNKLKDGMAWAMNQPQFLIRTGENKFMVGSGHAMVEVEIRGELDEPRMIHPRDAAQDRTKTRTRPASPETVTPSVLTGDKDYAAMLSDHWRKTKVEEQYFEDEEAITIAVGAARNRNIVIQYDKVKRLLRIFGLKENYESIPEFERISKRDLRFLFEAGANGSVIGFLKDGQWIEKRSPRGDILEDLTPHHDCYGAGLNLYFDEQVFRDFFGGGVLIERIEWGARDESGAFVRIRPADHDNLILERIRARLEKDGFEWTGSAGLWSPLEENRIRVILYLGDSRDEDPKAELNILIDNEKDTSLRLSVKKSEEGRMITRMARIRTGNIVEGEVVTEGIAIVGARYLEDERKLVVILDDKFYDSLVAGGYDYPLSGLVAADSEYLYEAIPARDGGSLLENQAERAEGEIEKPSGARIVPGQEIPVADFGTRSKNLGKLSKAITALTSLWGEILPLNEINTNKGRGSDFPAGDGFDDDDREWIRFMLRALHFKDLGGRRFTFPPQGTFGNQTAQLTAFRGFLELFAQNLNAAHVQIDDSGRITGYQQIRFLAEYLRTNRGFFDPAAIAELVKSVFESDAPVQQIKDLLFPPVDTEPREAEPAASGKISAASQIGRLTDEKKAFYTADLFDLGNGSFPGEPFLAGDAQDFEGLMKSLEVILNDDREVNCVAYRCIVLSAQIMYLLKTGRRDEISKQKLISRAKKAADMEFRNERWRADAYSFLIRALLAAGFEPEVTHKKYGGKNLIDLAREAAMREDDIRWGVSALSNLISALSSGGMQKEIAAQDLIGLAAEQAYTVTCGRRSKGLNRPEAYVHLITKLLAAGLVDEVLAKRQEGKNLIELAQEAAAKKATDGPFNVNEQELGESSTYHSEIAAALFWAGLPEEALAPKYGGKSLIDLARESALESKQTEAYVRLLMAYAAGGLQSEILEADYDGMTFLELIQESVSGRLSEQAVTFLSNVILALLTGGLKEEVTERKYEGKSLLDLAVESAMDASQESGEHEGYAYLISALFLGGMEEEALAKKYDGKSLIELAREANVSKGFGKNSVARAEENSFYASAFAGLIYYWKGTGKPKDGVDESRGASEAPSDSEGAGKSEQPAAQPAALMGSWQERLAADLKRGGDWALDPDVKQYSIPVNKTRPAEVFRLPDQRGRARRDYLIAILENGFATFNFPGLDVTAWDRAPGVSSAGGPPGPGKNRQWDYSTNVRFTDVKRVVNRTSGKGRQIFEIHITAEKFDEYAGNFRNGMTMGNRLRIDDEGKRITLLSSNADEVILIFSETAEMGSHLSSPGRKGQGTVVNAWIPLDRAWDEVQGGERYEEKGRTRIFRNGDELFAIIENPGDIPVHFVLSHDINGFPVQDFGMNNNGVLVTGNTGDGNRPVGTFDGNFLPFYLGHPLLAGGYIESFVREDGSQALIRMKPEYFEVMEHWFAEVGARSSESKVGAEIDETARKVTLSTGNFQIIFDFQEKTEGDGSEESLPREGGTNSSSERDSLAKDFRAFLSDGDSRRLWDGTFETPSVLAEALISFGSRKDKQLEAADIAYICHYLGSRIFPEGISMPPFFRSGDPADVEKASAFIRETVELYQKTILETGSDGKGDGRDNGSAITEDDVARDFEAELKRGGVWVFDPKARGWVTNGTKARQYKLPGGKGRFKKNYEISFPEDGNVWFSVPKLELIVCTDKAVGQIGVSGSAGELREASMQIERKDVRRVRTETAADGGQIFEFYINRDKFEEYKQKFDAGISHYRGDGGTYKTLRRMVVSGENLITLTNGKGDEYRLIFSEESNDEGNLPDGSDDDRQAEDVGTEGVPVPGSDGVMMPDALAGDWVPVSQILEAGKIKGGRRDEFGIGITFKKGGEEFSVSKAESNDKIRVQIVTRETTVREGVLVIGDEGFAGSGAFPFHHAGNSLSFYLGKFAHKVFLKEAFLEAGGFRALLRMDPAGFDLYKIEFLEAALSGEGSGIAVDIDEKNRIVVLKSKEFEIVFDFRTWEGEKDEVGVTKPGDKFADYVPSDRASLFNKNGAKTLWDAELALRLVSFIQRKKGRAKLEAAEFGRLGAEFEREEGIAVNRKDFEMFVDFIRRSGTLNTLPVSFLPDSVMVVGPAFVVRPEIRTNFIDQAWEKVLETRQGFGMGGGVSDEGKSGPVTSRGGLSADEKSYLATIDGVFQYWRDQYSGGKKFSFLEVLSSLIEFEKATGQKLSRGTIKGIARRLTDGKTDFTSFLTGCPDGEEADNRRSDFGITVFQALRDFRKNGASGFQEDYPATMEGVIRFWQDATNVGPVLMRFSGVPNVITGFLTFECFTGKRLDENVIRAVMNDLYEDYRRNYTVPSAGPGSIRWRVPVDLNNRSGDDKLTDRIIEGLRKLRPQASSLGEGVTDHETAVVLAELEYAIDQGFLKRGHTPFLDSVEVIRNPVKRPGDNMFIHLDAEDILYEVPIGQGQVFPTPYAQMGY
ncbi:MAG TPA: hypothetical protein PKL97_09170, partial [Candidatus Omnitrophota bacterium]|nr:hypothetical protein [Candidatus Omnitrophota bacterium]